MKNPKQSGFAAIEAVLVLVIVGILGFTGWFVWNAKQNTDASLDASVNAKQGIVTKKQQGAHLLPPGNPAPTSEVKTAKFSALPTELREAVTKHASCTNDHGQLLDETGNVIDNPDEYVNNAAAFISECQSIALYVYSNGHWTFIEKSQGGFTCKTLKKYDVPVALVNQSSPDGKCWDAAYSNSTTYQL